MTRFQFPAQLIESNDGYSAGDITVVQTFTVTFGDTGVTRRPFRLPKPYRIVDITVDTITAFNAATAVLDLGITGELQRFMAAVDIKAVGRVRASAVAAKLAGLRDLTGIDGSFDIVSLLTAAGGSAGLAEVTIEYACPRPRID